MTSEIGRLRQQVAIVTGATSGIGAAIAQRFASEGAKVAIVGRDVTRGGTVMDHISSAGGEATFVQADVASPDDTQRMVETVLNTYGRPTVLVNNVGLSVPGRVDTLTLEDWELVFRANVTSAYVVSHHVVPHFLQAGSGAIINISSETGLKGFPNRAAYCAAKAAIIGLTKAMAVDYSPHGIRVNAICPGTVETPMVTQIIEESPDPKSTRQQFIARRLTPYLGTPEQIAEAALYFASPENHFTTGAVLSVDGGSAVK